MFATNYKLAQKDLGSHFCRRLVNLTVFVAAKLVLMER